MGSGDMEAAKVTHHPSGSQTAGAVKGPERIRESDTQHTMTCGGTGGPGEMGCVGMGAKTIWGHNGMGG
eukprot:CAMPEP_0174328464 /NCGR_PEP_ID=MMETSP0810-20121108/15159_1 /TAXON_ID=73025 ORGANISM="Eutreptiella gymnastica-like, Strain CCMP1594" /NCGR_SAMPLE_ID=MMETSP0810 /ASSEMBLY_ACC=CAM_ASM_000659 /LENGTH=68 /DNA_ID=CAMNT_0015442569 /DNA_START=1323 /DNA_END=1526 /DNA_ORIENTATION=+